MSKLEKLGKVKIETELVDLGYKRIEVNGKKIVIVEFILKKAISPEEAWDTTSLIGEFVKSFVVPKEDEIVALSGRGPIFLYMMLAHKLAHVVTYLGVYDPKANTVIITSSHAYITKYSEGQVIELPEELKKELVQV